MHLFSGNRHRQWDEMNELNRIDENLKHQINIAVALKYAIDTLVKFSDAPYHGVTDWEAECRKIMVESGKALCRIEAILNPTKPQVPA